MVSTCGTGLQKSAFQVDLSFEIWKAENEVLKTTCDSGKVRNFIELGSVSRTRRSRVV